MKTQVFKLLSALALSVLFLYCTHEKEAKEMVFFKGYVVDVKNNRLGEVTVDINSNKTQTNQEGEFALEVPLEELYKMTASRKDYANASAVFLTAQSKLEIKMFDATVESFDPTRDIVLTDTKSTNRPGPTLSSASFNNAFSEIPVVYKNGKIVDFGFSPELQNAFDYVQSRKQAGPGVTISIPANSLTRNGNPPSGNVNVSVSTIDIFSPGAMPGDMTIVNREGERSGFMISVGAGSIEIFDDEGEFQLAKEASAKISIPLDSSAFVNEGQIPESIGLFYYNEDTGFWTEEGKAVLNRDNMSFEADLRHFSTFNMDFKVPTPSCLQIRHNSVGVTTLPAYKVEAIVDFGGSVTNIERTIEDPSSSSSSWPIGDPAACLENSNGTSVHMLYNLPENTDVCLIFYEPGTPDVAVGIAVTTTGPTYGASLPTCPNVACPASCVDNCSSTACGGYGSCTFVPFNRFTTAIILASNSPAAGTIDFKWVHNAAPGNYTYNVIEIDEFGNPIGTPVCTVAAVPADDPLSPKSCTVNGISSGQHFYKVIVVGSTDESQQVDENI